MPTRTHPTATTTSAPGSAPRQPSGDASRRLRRLATRHRRSLAACLVGIAVLAAVSALRPPPTVTRPVVVAAGDLPAGVVLRESDVRTIAVPADYAGAATIADPATVADRTLATPILAGEPVTTTRLVNSGLGSGGMAPGRGEVAAPIRIADPGVVGLLAPGDIVDVLVADEAEGQARVAARSVRVITIPRSRPTTDGGLMSPSGGGGTDGSLVLLAVTPTTAIGLAQAAAHGALSLVLHATP
jgi:pilus assembly protein CpaB